MHPLVAPVLLRPAWLYSLRLDPQPHPPHRQRRQPAPSVGPERRSVITAHSLRQSVFLKSSFQHRSRVLRIRRPYSLAAQQIPTVAVCDRQRIAAPSVSGPKPSLEIYAPQLIRLPGWRQRLGGGLPSRALFPRHRQPVLFQNRSDGAGRRHLVFPRSYPPLQQGPDLSRSPSRVLFPNLQYHLLHLLASLIGVFVRRPRFIFQSC